MPCTSSFCHVKSLGPFELLVSSGSSRSPRPAAFLLYPGFFLLLASPGARSFYFGLGSASHHRLGRASPGDPPLTAADQADSPTNATTGPGGCKTVGFIWAVSQLG